MASKKYRDKICVYCTEANSETADHVVARGFIPVSRRDGIPKVPACLQCNSDKSAFETYLSAFLPLGSTADSAMEITEQDLVRRINKNSRLARELRFMSGLKWKENDLGVFVPEMTLPLNPDIVVTLLNMIGRGLIWHHYSVLIPDGFSIQSSALTEHGENLIKQKFFPDLGGCVHLDVGNGAFQYVGKQSAEYPEFTIWLMRFYSGMSVSDQKGDDVSRCFLVMSGKEKLFGSKGIDLLFAGAA